MPLVITVVSYAAIFALLWKKMRAKDRRKLRRASSTVPNVTINVTEMKDLGGPLGRRDDIDINYDDVRQSLTKLKIVRTLTGITFCLCCAATLPVCMRASVLSEVEMQQDRK